MARLTLLLLCLAGCAGACTSAPLDLTGWPAATHAVASGMDQELADLTLTAQAALDLLALESGSAHAALRSMNEMGQARLAAWRALEDYCWRVLPLLHEAPYDGRGVRALAESWRTLIDALPGVSTESTAKRDETARAMISANTTTSALQAADAAAARLCEDLNSRHQELSEAVLAAGAELAALQQASESVMTARHAALTELIVTAETELRKEAAGAGVARPGSQATLDANRPELARLEAQLAEAARARSLLNARFATAADRVKRAGFAAREWAVAHREAGQALRRGLPEANFRLLQASAADLGPRPESERGAD
jgi:hypothetical protein